MLLHIYRTLINCCWSGVIKKKKLFTGWYFRLLFGNYEMMVYLYILFLWTGTLPLMSTPASSVAVTTPTASLLGNTQVTHIHTQLKVPNPTTIQLRPQMYSALQNSNIAMAMQNRLSLPFQTSGSQNLAVPTSINTLRALPPGSISATSVLPQQVQFQTVAPLRGTAVTMATSAQPGQQQAAQAQQMSIRSAAAFPLLFNRPITFTGTVSSLLIHTHTHKNAGLRNDQCYVMWLLGWLASVAQTLALWCSWAL